MHKDRLGNDLAVGDRVVWCDSRYADLKVGFVTGFTPKRIKVWGERNSQLGEIKTSVQVAKIE